MRQAAAQSARLLGKATGAVHCVIKDDGCYQAFQNGALFYSPRTGAQPVVKAMWHRYRAQGFENGPWGYPTAGPVTNSDGSVTQPFEGGSQTVAPPAPKPAPKPKPKPKPITKPTAPSFKNDAALRRSIIAAARKGIGTPYVWGGTSPTRGWDCSGFTQYVYGKHGIRLPRVSGQQRSAGRPISASQAKPGDLLWAPGHIAIVSDKKGMMIDAGSRRTGTSERSYKWMVRRGGVFLRFW